MKRPTLKTIALELNLSVSAVSRIINGKGKSIGLNDQTIKDTLEFAQKIGYRPHKHAQNLRLGKTNTIGVLLTMPEDGNNDSDFRLIKGISQAAVQYSQALMFFDVSDHSSALTAVEKCINAGVDGIIAAHIPDPAYMNRLDEIIKNDWCVVMLLNPDRHYLDCPNIKIDEKHGGFLATDYLIKKGHKRIAHLAHRVSMSSGLERFEGYKEALAAANISYNEDLVVEESADFTGANVLLAKKELPDAVFCWNDKSAAKAQQIFSNAKAKIEITGFDNREFIKYLEKPFNSVDAPFAEVGRVALKTLLAGKLSRHDIVIKPRMVEYCPR